MKNRLIDAGIPWFVGAEMDKPVYLGGVLGFESASIRDIGTVLRANYCGSVGLEYMHIADTEERRFLQDRMEAKTLPSNLPQKARRRSSTK